MICAGTKLIMQGRLEFVSNKKERKTMYITPCCHELYLCFAKGV
jgi:hypothetical protein